MAEIRPFAALRYAPDADPARVTCPPYDVLSPEERQALIARSPHATARLILPEGEGEAKYRNAADLFQAWQRDGILREDATPGYYVTRTEFTDPGTSGTRRQRLGLIGLLRLHEYADNVVLPHEKTLSKPKEDRLSLLRATNANFESIMGLVDDSGGALYAALEEAVTAAAPLIEFDGDDAQRHALWKVEDPALMARIAQAVAAGPVFIADGHHRYETSVAFAREAGALGTDRPEAFLLTTLCSFADPGLVLLPTHRLVRGTPSEAATSLFRHLEEHFDVQEVDREDLESRLRMPIEDQPVFGLVMPSGTLYRVTGRLGFDLTEALPANLDPSLQNLQVILLQYLILDKVLGIPAAEVATTDRLAYTRDVDEAIRRVHDGEFDLALLLGRPPVEAVRDVSLAGEVMPQKSTFFYPKLLSGLVLRRIGI